MKRQKPLCGILQRIHDLIPRYVLFLYHFTHVEGQDDLAAKDGFVQLRFLGYIDICGSNKGLGRPKDGEVDGNSYLGKLRKRIGVDFDLPTEVQWEYACRAGTKGDFNVDGVEMVKLGKCRDNGGLRDFHVKVGSFMPNAWGLYDMHGNVWERCLDRGTDESDGCFRFFGWNSEPKESVADPKGPAVGASRIVRGGGASRQT